MRTTGVQTMKGRNRMKQMLLWTGAILMFLPGASLADALVIEGGTVHPITGEPFVGRVVIEDGLIKAVGADASAPGGATRIDATGLHVYPGMFDALSQLGLLEVNAVPATDDQAEMGMYNPHLKAATAIHPSSELIPVTRANGVTHAVTAPQTGRDGVIAGQAALIHLAGWTVEEMAIEPSIAMVIVWPEIQTRRFDFSTFSVVETPFNEAKENAEKAQNELRDWVDAARHYSQASGSARVPEDQKLAALARCLDGGMTVIIHANAKRDIEAAIGFAEEEGMRMILAGGRDAWKVAELLAEKEIPVILGITQSLPNEDDLPYDRPYGNPGLLVEAGVTVAFASGAGGGFGPGGPHDSRGTPYQAQAAVPFGLTEEEALRAMTLNPAEMLGVGDRLGSIEPGKIANLIVTDGSPLEIHTQIRHLVIAGEEVSTDNLHQELYERYRSR
jgi:imidazolonepropionase-like amidohydrolase